MAALDLERMTKQAMAAGMQNPAMPVGTPGKKKSKLNTYKEAATPMLDAYTGAQEEGKSIFTFKGKRLRTSLGIGETQADDSFAAFLRKL